MTTIAATIAQATRAEIKAARKAGTIQLPESAKVAVRSRTFAGGAAVIVDVTLADEAWACTTRDSEYGVVAAPTTAAKAAGDEMTRILLGHGQGRVWGDVKIAGLNLDGGRVKPATARYFD